MAPLRSLQGLATTLTTLALLISVYVIGLILYRVFLHPLAKYPGPFIAKFTSLYSIYHAWKGDRHLDVQACHEKYGPVFRYGPNKLSFNTGTAAHTINGAKANTRKADFYQLFQSPAGPSILSAIPHELHARKKKVLSQAFSDKAVKSTEEYTLSHLRKFCEHLASASQPLDMSKWCTYLTGDVLGEVCFGNSFNALTTHTNRRLLELISPAAHYSLIVGTSIGSTFNLQNPTITKLLFPSTVAGRNEFRTWAMSHAGQRTKLKDSSRRDFYHYLMEATNPDTNEKLTERELWSEATNFIIAGTDTTATTLSATFFYLTRNREALEKATREVRSVFAGKDVEDIKSGEVLNSCRYLRACIDESMRMSPPAPGILPRAVLAGGITIDGHHIPEGVEVGVSAYALHHNEKYFKDSFKYDPDRFMGETLVEGFMPFSYGPRGCIGKNMAYMELMCTMARVLWLFDIKGVGSVGESRERKGEYRTEDFFVCHKRGPMVEFKLRGDNS